MLPDTQLIAPCGMYCGLCSSYLAYLNQVPRQRGKFTYCTGCRPRGKQCSWIKRCEHHQEQVLQYCFECPDYPCQNLEHLSERYRKKYGMSFLENLTLIRDQGEGALLAKLYKRYACDQCTGLKSIHSAKCFACDEVHSWKD